MTFARPDEQIGAIDAFDVTGGGAITAAWHTALQEALDRTLIFRDEGITKVSISVKIMKLDARDWRTGLNMITEVVARYEIISTLAGRCSRPGARRSESFRDDHVRAGRATPSPPATGASSTIPAIRRSRARWSGCSLRWRGSRGPSGPRRR